MSRKPLLYPDRPRCRACRRYFGFTVVLRMYCSHECAGLPEQSWGPEDLPRCCKVFRDGEWRPKVRYYTARAAAKGAKKNGKNWYQCDGPEGCGLYHLTKQSQPREGA